MLVLAYRVVAPPPTPRGRGHHDTLAAARWVGAGGQADLAKAAVGHGEALAVPQGE